MFNVINNSAVQRLPLLIAAGVWVGGGEGGGVAVVSASLKL